MFIKGFIKNLYLRKSCFQCRFKGYERCSDITIGDFWGINEKHSAFANKSGNSVVIIHSKKGQEWFHKVKDNLYFEKASYKEASVFNESLIESVKETELRDRFYSQWGNGSVSEVITSVIKDEETINNSTTEQKQHSTLWQKIRTIIRNDK